MSSVPKKTYLFDIKPLILSSMTNFWTRPRVPGCIFRSPSAARKVGTVVPSKMLNLMQVKQSVQIGRLGSLKQPRRRRPQRRLKKKTKGLMIKTKVLHVHHALKYISNLTIYGGRRHNTTHFPSSFRAWVKSLRIQLQEKSPAFDILSGSK